MGTDIHFFVERKVEGFWLSCDEWTDEGYWHVSKYFYENRNYDLFAILANVRNGFGFAGVDTGEGFFPISEPRGLPTDLSEELQRQVDNCLDHTPSWLTVAELLAYDWTQETTKSGILSLQEYLRWRAFYSHDREWPRSWCGGISGPDIVVHKAKEIEAALVGLNVWNVANRRGITAAEIATRLGVPSNEVLEDREAGGAWNYRQNHHVRAEWKASYARCAQDFLSETMPRLWRLGRPEDVRCVFYFDS